KEELFSAAMLSVFVDFGHEAFASLAACETAEEKLRAVGSAMGDFVVGLEGIFIMFLGYWASHPSREEVGLWWTDLLVEYKDQLVAIVQEGIDNGEFKAVDAEALVWVVMAAYDGLAAYCMLLPNVDPHRASRVFVETLLGGLLLDGWESD
ncbi:MAG TPA: hypothetical protein VLY63_21670, partial [Anaerolineae bacterium]|nr:hypothetical protein [Anaerolineae bacterium]